MQCFAAQVKPYFAHRSCKIGKEPCARAGTPVQLRPKVKFSGTTKKTIPLKRGRGMGPAQGFFEEPSSDRWVVLHLLLNQGITALACPRQRKRAALASVFECKSARRSFKIGR
jgi:hypothetical protein